MTTIVVAAAAFLLGVVVAYALRKPGLQSYIAVSEEQYKLIQQNLCITCRGTNEPGYDTSCTCQSNVDGP